MLLPISVLWIQIISVIFSFMLGRYVSKFVEPVYLDNIIKESHNIKLPIYMTTIMVLIFGFSLIFLKELYIPSYETIRSLTIQLNVGLNISYFLTHTFSFFTLPTVWKFISYSGYKYRVLILILGLMLFVGIIHFIAFVGFLLVIVFGTI